MSYAGESDDIKESFVEDANKVNIEATINLDCVKNEPNEEALDFENHAARYKITLEYENIFGEPSHQLKIEEDNDNLIGFLDNDVIMENAMIKLEAIKEEDDGSFNNIRDAIDEITEEETKVDIEEASVNLKCVKNELAEEVVKFEENLHATQYRVTFENIFGVSSSKRNFEEYNGNLLGFVDNDAIMENVIIKLEVIKEEGGHFHYCNKCNGDYKGFCLKCSTLTHVLNNASQLTSTESEINTVPKDILEIRDISVEKGVFLLKTLPKNIIFGPFEGISVMRNVKGDGWKINNSRLENTANGNWMKDIGCATSALIKNLDIFQMKENLYFKTNRPIMEGEELLVYYDDEEVRKLDDSQECYFIPQKQEDLPKVFACTLCCLGFQLFKCLMEHKSKCPHADYNTEIKDFELVECHCCEIWLEKQEYQEYHMAYCWEKYLRMSYRHLRPVERNDVKVEEIENGLDSKAVDGGFKCSQCSYETNDEKNLQRHLNTHKKFFQCDICKMNYSTKNYLKFHIKNKHTEDGCAKDYQCSKCPFQTNYKNVYQAHLNGHRGIKPFKCGTCKTKFTQKHSLRFHIKDKHSENGCAKDYQCSQCTYETNDKRNYQNHLNGHRGVKPFECGICQMKFTRKQSLKNHTHLNYHSGIKPFDCGICKAKFTHKQTLRFHIKDKHSENGCAKDYQCSECTYETNDKRNYQNHLNGHRGIKPFECGICQMKFTRKQSLKNHTHLNYHSGIKPFDCGICKAKFTHKQTLRFHIKDKHSENGCAKDYQCSECTYETNDKRNYQNHLNGHRGIKPFECGICQMKFTRKQSLKNHTHLNYHSGIKPFDCGICKAKFTHKQTLRFHIKDKHSENGCAKDYQCSECTYETNDKRNYQNHLNRHRGIKPFECGICQMKFTRKQSLKNHTHLNYHSGIKPFDCGICKAKFTHKQTLRFHIKDKHSENGCAKDYQCSECTYETNDKRNYQNHLNGHRGIKPFECGICQMKFTRKQSLKNHIKNKHAENGSAKEYHCLECTYQTNYKRDYQTHLNGHRGIKPFECGICQMKFTRKQSLKNHIKNKHAENGSAKEYHSLECTYQTNYKRDYQTHLNVHSGIKPFECGICQMKFTKKQSLKNHIKKKHTERKY